MIKALFSVLGIAVIVIGAVAVAVVYRPRPPLPLADKRLLDDAAALFARLSHPTSLDRLDLLTDESKAATARWLKRYNERHAK